MQNNHRSRIQFEISVGQLPVICRSGERSPKARHLCLGLWETGISSAAPAAAL